MSEQNLYMNFSGIYELQDFCKGTGLTEVDVSDIQGTNCYCDDEAMEQIRKRIQPFSMEGIHFLDSGNYHYMTRIWMEKIQEPFSLLVFDNHTDLQLPAFGGILSCGGWIAASLEELPMLKEVILIGPDEAAYEAVEEQYRSRVHFYSREKLEETKEGEVSTWFSSIELTTPFYISVDKDILAPTELKTNWSQGNLTVERLLAILHAFSKELSGQKQRLLGMDVCGECDLLHPEMIDESSEINRRLLEYWTDPVK